MRILVLLIYSSEKPQGEGDTIRENAGRVPNPITRNLLKKHVCDLFLLLFRSQHGHFAVSIASISLKLLPPGPASFVLRVVFHMNTVSCIQQHVSPADLVLDSVQRRLLPMQRADHHTLGLTSLQQTVNLVVFIRSFC